MSFKFQLLAKCLILYNLILNKTIVNNYLILFMHVRMCVKVHVSMCVILGWKIRALQPLGNCFTTEIRALP